MGRSDIAKVLRGDRNGVELQRLNREFKLKREELLRTPGLNNRELIAKAYDSSLALLPVLWRLEQRK